MNTSTLQPVICAVNEINQLIFHLDYYESRFGTWGCRSGQRTPDLSTTTAVNLGLTEIHWMGLTLWDGELSSRTLSVRDMIV